MVNKDRLRTHTESDIVHQRAVPCLNNGRAQAVKIHSGASRDVCLGRLASSDVRQAEASFPADKARGELSRATEDLPVSINVDGGFPRQ